MKILDKAKKVTSIFLVLSILIQTSLPLVSYAAPQNLNVTDSRNSLETIGTKANRLKLIGNSGVDASTGAFTYSYPMTLPKGKFGLEPDITVSYNSQNQEDSMV